MPIWRDPKPIISPLVLLRPDHGRGGSRGSRRQRLGTTQALSSPQGWLTSTSSFYRLNLCLHGRLLLRRVTQGAAEKVKR